MSYQLSISLYPSLSSLSFFFNNTATTEIYTLSLHDALPIYLNHHVVLATKYRRGIFGPRIASELIAYWGLVATKRSEEHTSELQSLRHLVCRLLLEKKKKK